MLDRRMARFVNVTELLKYGVVVKKFVAHKWHTVSKLLSKGAFGNPLDFYKPPSAEVLNDVRGYFGEEMAFFFHWFRFYTIQLVFPAMLGGLIFFRRYFLEPDNQRLLQDGYASLSR